MVKRDWKQENKEFLNNRQIDSTKNPDLQHALENIQVIYSGRKTICIQIDRRLQIKVRAPYRTPKQQIVMFVEKNRGWIESHFERMVKQKEQAEKQEEAGDKVECGKQAEEQERIRQLTMKAKIVIPQRVTLYANIMGVDYGRITIRHQKTRWGSCSGKGNLNFNCYLMAMPAPVVDYVVIHELCHRKEMNHSKAFWTLVERMMPDYRQWRKWLKDHGDEVLNGKDMSRLQGIRS